LKILIIQTAFLGDVLLSTPVFQSIRKNFPQSEITVLTTPQAAPLLENLECVSDILIFDKHKKDQKLINFFYFIKKVRKRNFDMVICLHRSVRSCLLTIASGAPIRIGFEDAKLKHIFFKKVFTRLVKKAEQVHAVERFLSILNGLNIAKNLWSNDLQYTVTSAEAEESQKLLPGLDQIEYVAIAPGSVWPTKQWTLEGFTELTKKLQHQRYGVILLGGPADQERGEKIYAALSEQEKTTVVDLMGKLSLRQSTAILQNCRAMVTNDSFPLHLASTLKVPTIAVFCSTIPEFGFGPWKNQHQIIEVKDLACRPCGRHGKKICPTGTEACMKGISSQKVFSAVLDLINQKELNQQYIEDV
jgi:heptosyltransferase II